MVETQKRRIVRDLMDEPHIEGRRISVLQLYERVEERGLDSQTVAARFDLDVADVYRALAYYHEHPEEMATVREEREQAEREIRAAIERPDGVTPRTDVIDE